jgi:hypothetical protein
MNPFHVPVLALAAWLTAPACPAQQQDPMHEIQEIARRIDEQMQEIDRLLLESGKKNQSRARPKELLDQAHTSSKSAEDGIDTLIDLLNKMKGQSSSSSSQSQQQQDQQQDEQDQQSQGQKQHQQGQRNRRENKTPEFTERQRPQQGEQKQGQQPQGQQPQGEQQSKPNPQGDPKGGQETPDGGQNARGNHQPEPQTGPGSPGTGEGSWGELQPYMNFLKNRGSQPPDVPEKFRKYWEAYLKQQQAAGKGGGK